MKTKRLVKIFLLPLFLLLLASCATSPAAGPRSSNRELLWPPLPMESRIQWVSEFRDYHEVGITKGFWKMIGEFVFGEEETRLRKPYGVYKDDRDRIFVVDVGAAVVHVFDRKKNQYYTIGDHGKPLLRTPIAVTEDERENLFVSDAGSGRVYTFNLRKKELREFGPTRLGRPTGIAYNRTNKLLYVTDTAAHQVIAFRGDGTEELRIGTRGDAPGEFNYPTDLFVTPQGELYVTDALNGRIQIFSPDGKYLRSFGVAGDTPGFFDKPKGVAVDSEGHVYVCEAMFDTIQIFDQNGRFLLNFGSTGDEEGELRMPSGIYIDRDDLIYVADSFNKRIQIFKYLKQKKGKSGAE